MAKVDYFLKLEGIEGESEDETHRDEIQLKSWNWGATNSGTMQMGGGGGAGKSSVEDFKFTMTANKATPKLVQRLLSGEHIPKAVLTCRKQGKKPQEYLIITFENVVVSSYKTRGGGDEEKDDKNVIPLEEIALNFAKIEFEYHPQKDDGSLGGAIVASHDLKRNRTT